MADRVTFVPSAAERIAAAVRGFEAGERDGSPLTFKRPIQTDSAARVRYGKTTAAWNKNTLATIELWEEGSPNAEAKKSPTADTLADCVNKMADIPSSTGVHLARGPFGAWYLIAAEC